MLICFKKQVNGAETYGIPIALLTCSSLSERGNVMVIFEEREIQKKGALSSTYRKGKTLYEDQAVESLDMIREAGQNVRFEAGVKGSGGRKYEVSIGAEWVSPEKHVRLGKGYCTCKAFQEYGGFCKHLTATALEVNSYVDLMEIQEFLEESEEEECYVVLEPVEEPEEVPPLDPYDWRRIATASGRVFSGGSTSVQPRSSKELLDVISEMALQERNRFCQEISQGEVELEVTLQLSADSEELSLRIGKKQMYVVKSIRELIQNIREQRYVKYGKNLEFVHTQGAFSKETLPLISFLLGVQFPENSYLAFYKSSIDGRNLQLDAGMLDELMELFEGKSILVNRPMRTERIVTEVKREDPFLPVKIEAQKKRKAVQILCPEIFLLEGIRHLYVWWGNCIYICSEEYAGKMKEVLKVMAVNYTRGERDGNSHFYRSLKPQRKLDLCEKDYTSFVATLLPVLEKDTDLRVKGIDFSEYEPQEGIYEVYLDLTEAREVVCEARAVYGEKEHNLAEVASVGETYRNIQAEYEIRTLLKGYFPEKTADGKKFLLREDDDRLAELVENGIRQMEEMTDVYVSEAFKTIRIAPKTVVTTGLSMKGNLLEVSWDVTGMSQNELYDILHAYRRKKKYFRLKTGELLNLKTSGLEVLADMQEDLQLTKSQLQSGSVSLPAYRALYMDALMKENAERLQVRRDEAFRKYLGQLEEISERKYTIPEAVQGELRGYQKEGFAWACALKELGFGGILADDMGLGKTLQMIAFLCRCEGETHLIVCPASLVYNWEAEFQKFAPTMKLCLMVGNAKEREDLLESYREYDVVITSYDLLRRDIENYEGKSFGCEIIDEAQYIKNPSTQASKAVKMVDSRVRFALTGTPIENRLSELWSIFEYLMPGYLYSYKHFKETFEEKILQSSEEEAGKALNRLHQMISPFLMRRLKKEVLKELPEKLEEVVYTKFASEQKELYRATEKNIVTNLRQKSGEEVRENKLQILAELTRLRQICCDPSLLYENYTAGSAKLETCMEVIGNALEGGHKILLFSQFTSMLQILEKRLKKEKVRYFVLTGSTSKLKRKELVERFQRGEADLFLISLKAGGTGLNLTAADVVIHYDPWWNVAAQNQATDRTHRIGQENEVTVFKLIARDTIEERILKLQEKKQDLADKVVSAEGVSVASLSREDLLGLFGGEGY